VANGLRSSSHISSVQLPLAQLMAVEWDANIGFRNVNFTITIRLKVKVLFVAARPRYGTI